MKHTIQRKKESPPSRILMIAPQPWFQPRGTPFSVLHRIKALSHLGHKIDLCTYHLGQNIAIQNLSIYRALSLPFIKNVKIGPSRTKAFLDIFLIFVTLKLLLTNKYDIIHTHEEAAFWGVPLAKLFHIPHLYDMHSSLPQQLHNFKFTTSRFFIRLFEKLESWVIKNSAAAITICPELQNYVEQHFPEKQSLLIENVADNSVVFPPLENKNNLQQKYNLKSPIVLYYGTFEPYQGIDLLIKSAVKVIEQLEGLVHFVLVGGQTVQVDYYSQIAKEQNVSPYFTFTGFQPPEVIPGFVSLADVLVSPRLQGTNSPLKIYSYLRSGKPVVATRHVTHTQILNDSVAILVEPSSEAFAKGIVVALTNSDKTSHLVKNAKKLAENAFSYQSYLDKTQLVIEKTLEATS